MNLELLLWVIGTGLTLSAFAVKLGVALGLSKPSKSTIALVLFTYASLFLIISLLAKPFLNLLMKVLLKGSYLHLLLSLGLILWGVYLLTRKNFQPQEEHSVKLSLPLLLPCPVCLSAMSFSVAAFLSATQLPPYLVGLGLGLAFILFSLVFFFIVRIWAKEFKLATLGLAMIGVGAYLSLSFIVPEKVEEAKKIYKTFVSEELFFPPYALYILLIIFLAFLFGFLFKPQRKIKREV
jgi:predicted transporter